MEDMEHPNNIVTTENEVFRKVRLNFSKFIAEGSSKFISKRHRRRQFKVTTENEVFKKVRLNFSKFIAKGSSKFISKRHRRTSIIVS